MGEAFITYPLGDNMKWNTLSIKSNSKNNRNQDFNYRIGFVFTQTLNEMFISNEVHDITTEAAASNANVKLSNVRFCLTVMTLDGVNSYDKHLLLMLNLLATSLHWIALQHSALAFKNINIVNFW